MYAAGQLQRGVRKHVTFAFVKDRLFKWLERLELSFMFFKSKSYLVCLPSLACLCNYNSSSLPSIKIAPLHSFDIPWGNWKFLIVMMSNVYLFIDLFIYLFIQWGRKSFMAQIQKSKAKSRVVTSYKTQIIKYSKISITKCNKQNTNYNKIKQNGTRAKVERYFSRIYQ